MLSPLGESDRGDGEHRRHDRVIEGDVTVVTVPPGVAGRARPEEQRDEPEVAEGAFGQQPGAERSDGGDQTAGEPKVLAGDHQQDTGTARGPSEEDCQIEQVVDW